MEAFAEEARRLVRFRSQTLALPIAVAPGVLAHNANRFRNANPGGAYARVDVG